MKPALYREGTRRPHELTLARNRPIINSDIQVGRNSALRASRRRIVACIHQTYQRHVHA